MKKPLRIAFFGTSEFSVHVLEELIYAEVLPQLIVTGEDKRSGRKLELTPTPVKEFARAHNIETIEPKTLSDDKALLALKNSEWDLFILASYGKIIPQALLDIPKYGMLNIHPSLLPKLRGASPVRTAILTDQKDAVGVTIMEVDKELDHGPIVAQARIEPEDWPIGAIFLEELLAREGAKLLVGILGEWTTGTITPQEQDHVSATYAPKITKLDGGLNLTDNPFENFRKIKALEGWPGTFFFVTEGEKQLRVKVIDAELDYNGAFKILRVIPEGKREMDYNDFLRGRN
jgi:methionyl-tRNA formyltransferase